MISRNEARRLTDEAIEATKRENSAKIDMLVNKVIERNDVEGRAKAGHDSLTVFLLKYKTVPDKLICQGLEVPILGFTGEMYDELFSRLSIEFRKEDYMVSPVIREHSSLTLTIKW